MPPNIHFDHLSSTENPALLPAAPFVVGRMTAIAITLNNDGNVTGTARIRLFWKGPTGAVPTGTTVTLLDKLEPPNNRGVPIPLTVVAGTSSTLQVSWTPTAAMFPRALGRVVRGGCLFAQVDVDPVMPGYAGDTSAQNNWNPDYRLCAQHNSDIAT
jgi:hypothetical protein